MTKTITSLLLFFLIALSSQLWSEEWSYRMKLRGIDEMGFEGFNAHGELRLQSTRQAETERLNQPLLYTVSPYLCGTEFS